MIALLSTVLGFAGSLVPKLLELMQDRNDKAHELRMIEMQQKLDAQRADASLEQSLAAAYATQVTSVQESYRRDIEASMQLGNSRTAAFSASVRPAITYLFFTLYAGVKVAQFCVVFQPALPWLPSNLAPALAAIWGEEDMALFAAVMAFWFGDRSFRPKR